MQLYAALIWVHTMVFLLIIQWIRISDSWIRKVQRDRHQNLITCSLGHALPLQEISSKSVLDFSVIRRTDRQTDRNENITSFFGGGNYRQWRSQTIKWGSAFKGQLYFQVGQMEGPTVPSDFREAQSTEEGRFGKGRCSPSPLGGLWAMPQKNFQKINFEIACFLHYCKLKWFHLQRRQGNFDFLITLYR